MAGQSRRRCACQTCDCPTLLARDNKMLVCHPCARHAATSGDITSAAEFWTHPTLQEARLTRDMGAVCRAYRAHPANRSADGKPLSQESIAARVGVSQVQICRIEKGTNRVRDVDKLIRWAKALGMPASYAWFELPDELHVSAPPEPACSFEEEQPAKEEDVKRRTLIAKSLATGAAMAAAGIDAQPWERLTLALQNPSRLTTADVDELEHDTLDYFRREEFAPARQLAPGLRQHVERLSRLLSGGIPEHLRGRLLSTIGEAMALYGWFAFDRNDKATALRFYGLAASAAHDAGDDALTACILGYRSYLSEVTGDQRQARDMLAAAQRSARSPSSAATRAWLAAREAEIRATMHEATDALRALDRATTAFDYARPQHERAWTAFFVSSRLGSMAVTTYTRLNHPRLGATADSVLAGLGPDDAKIKAIILADLATASIHRQAYDQGAALATQALSATTSQEVSIGADRLRSLRRQIRPHLNLPVLADLDNRLATALA